MMNENIGSTNKVKKRGEKSHPQYWKPQIKNTEMKPKPLVDSCKHVAKIVMTAHFNDRYQND